MNMVFRGFGRPGLAHSIMIEEDKARTRPMRKADLLPPLAPPERRRHPIVVALAKVHPHDVAGPFILLGLVVLCLHLGG